MRNSVQNIKPNRIKYTKTKYTLKTSDNVTLLLHRFNISNNTPSVLLLHGLSLSSAMFYGEEWYNLTDYLLNHGYEDVWVLDWRGSGIYKGEHVNADHNLDDVALIDIPLSVEFIQEKITGHLHLIGHCLGSLAMSMSLASQKIKGIRSAICANLGLYPKLNMISFTKLLAVPQFSESVLHLNYYNLDVEEMDFQSAEYLLHQAANLGPSKCDNPTCRILSFIFGSGDKDAIFKHENMHPKTHDRLNDYFGPVSFSYYKHLQKMLMFQSAVSACTTSPVNYLDLAEHINIPMLLTAGKENRCWFDSISCYHETLNHFFPNVAHELFIVPDYCHNDVFMGVNSYMDVFPRFIKFLNNYN